MNKLISWVEIPATNFERAVDFYSILLKINFQVFDCENEKMACFPSGEGAISQAKGFKPSSDGALVSFSVGDQLDKVINQVASTGGMIHTPKTKIEAEGKGYFALIIDCEGNKIGLHGN